MNKRIPIKIKKDTYRKKRGNFSKIILLKCKQCKNKIGYHQKDGDGWLKRLYLDRLYLLPNLKPPKFILEEYLTCQKCKNKFAKAIIYKKENRKAFSIIKDSLIKIKIFQDNQ
jgi:hypothetical protein